MKIEFPDVVKIQVMSSMLAKMSNAEYLYESYKLLDENYQIWKDSPYLTGIPEQYIAKVARIFDNQLKHKQVLVNQDSLSQQMLQKSIELEILQKVFQKCILFDIISVQPMRGAKDIVFYNRFVKPLNEDSKPQLQSDTISCVTKIHFNYNVKDESQLDFTDNIATRLRKQVANTILKNIRFNVGTIYDNKININGLNQDQVYTDIFKTAEIVYRKNMMLRCNFAIMSPKIASLFKGYNFIDFANISEPTYVGVLWNALKLYVDPESPENEILIGAYNEDKMPGTYIFSPYVMYNKIEDGNIRMISSRCSHKLPTNGARFFGKIRYNINN